MHESPPQPSPDPHNIGDGWKGNKPVYRYYVAETLTHEIKLELPFTGVSWGRKIRRAGSFTGTVHVDPENDELDLFWGTMPGRSVIYVTRFGQPVWGGMIDSRSYQDGQLTVNATSFEGYLYRRYIWNTHKYGAKKDQYQVVRELIDKMNKDFQDEVIMPDPGVNRRPAQANIGITVENLFSGIQQPKLVINGHALKSYGEVLEAFSSQANGFEYNIEIWWDQYNQQFVRELQFREAPPSQMPEGTKYMGPRPGLDTNFFEYPGNIISINYDDSIEGAATRYYVTGKSRSTGSSKPRGVWNNAAYLNHSWPLLEFVESSARSGISDPKLLKMHARRYGQLVKPPIPTWEITVNGWMPPEVGTYVPGDWCRVIVNDAFLRKQIELSGLEETGVVKRIAEYNVTVPDTEHVPEQVTYTLIDEWQSEDSGV